MKYCFHLAYCQMFCINGIYSVSFHLILFIFVGFGNSHSDVALMLFVQILLSDPNYLFIICCNNNHPRWLTAKWLTKDGQQRSSPFSSKLYSILKFLAKLLKKR